MPMNCPRCQATDVQGDACPRCGVIFSKLKAAPPRSPSARPPAADPRASSVPYFLFLGVGLLVLGVVVVRIVRPRPSKPPMEPVRSASLATLPSAAMPPPPQAEVYVPPVVLALSASPAPGVGVEDAALAERLVGSVRSQRVTDDDVQAAAALSARHPGELPLRGLLYAILLIRAQRERVERRFDQAQGHLKRAIDVFPGEVAARRSLVDLFLETAEWASAEAQAREALAFSPFDAGLHYTLGYALLRLDRNKDAVEALRASLEIRESVEARSLLERIQKNLADESGMKEQQISHFNVRYDGEAHEDVGREILRALERHYATLEGRMDHQIGSKVSVILFSGERYYDASGAPTWSGGVFDHLDGRIRIPIAGLTSGLTPDMDNVLLHELTHAFINDRTRGLAPRDLHEGVAQYNEGKRAASLLGPTHMAALADGHLGGVGGFYAAALSFAEYLMEVRGQGGVNDLLKAIGDTGDVDEAYRRVYGKDMLETHRAWAQRLKQQYGS